MQLKGTVSRIFCSKSSGFKILVLDVERSQHIPAEYINPQFPTSVSVAGPMKEAEIGYVIEVTGEWEKRENENFWPWQVKARGCTVRLFETPQLVTEVIANLAGIGMQNARQMVSVYGIQIVPILESEYERLRMWETYSGQMEEASKELKQFRLSRDLRTFLFKFNVNASDIEKIQERFGLEAMERIKTNPYLLCNERLISFKTCDGIAADMGFSRTSRNRVEAVFLYALKERAGGKGHTYLSVTQLLEESNAFLRDNAEIPGSFTRTVIADHIQIFVKERKIVADGDKIYAVERYQNECDVSDILERRRFMQSPYAEVEDAVISECISEMQEELGFELDLLQKNAVVMAIKSQTSILTGGPGCGKTSTLRTVVGVLERLNRKMGRTMPQIALAAPTGMAAKRIVSATGKEAKTIHKLLEYNPAAPFQMHCKNNPIDAEYVILDEASMVDIDIAAMLLRAVPDTVQILILGDTNQLPSIGPGEVLAHIIASEFFPIVKLEKSFRHGSRRHILENANRIINGDINLDIRHSDFQFFEVPDLPNDKECRRLLAKLKKVFFEEYAAAGRDASKIQVLSPLRIKTAVSADKLNPELQKMVNAALDPEDDVYYGTACFRRNDRVMQISNSYDKNIFNGDMGVVTMTSAKTGRLLVDYDGVTIEYQKKEFDQLKHCFAVTIHKSQGNEFPIVIIPITGYHSTMLMRNLIYTGVTRAKQKLILIGDKNALAYAIQNEQGIRRNSALLERMTANRKAA